MKITSNYINFTSTKEIESIFSDSDSVDLENLQYEKSKLGSGYRVALTLLINGKPYDYTTTIIDTAIIDNWFDDEGNIAKETFVIIFEMLDNHFSSYPQDFLNQKKTI